MNSVLLRQQTGGKVSEYIAVRIILVLAVERVYRYIVTGNRPDNSVLLRQ